MEMGKYLEQREESRKQKASYRATCHWHVAAHYVCLLAFQHFDIFYFRCNEMF
jgi:hypothetical protein